MNPSKIGTFISILRRERNMTQQDLGDLLGISGKSVSKWERGINCPDISMLSEIAQIFDVSIEELLKGEKNDTEVTIKDDGKYFKRILILTIFAILILVIVLIIKNHYQYNVYRIESNSKMVDVDGYIIFNPNNEIFLINTLNYKNASRKYADQITFILKNEEKELFNYQTTNYLEKKDISDILKETSINIKKSDESDEIGNLVLEILFNDEKMEISLRISEKLTNSFLK